MNEIVGSTVSRAEVEDLFYYEADLLDSWRLDDWLALLTDDAAYYVPPNDKPDADARYTLFTIADDIVRLRERVIRLKDPNCHAEYPLSRTRRLIGKLFDLKDLWLQDLKGVAGRVRVYAALRRSSIESRFEALHDSGLAALVGREEEAELLMRRWAKAKSGKGQVVLLSGEAGIGKSRLTAALL